MKRICKYTGSLFLAGLLTVGMMLPASAQRGGHSGGGGGFSGGGGTGFHGSSGLSAGVRGPVANNGAHGPTGVRGNAAAGGAVGVRSGTGYFGGYGYHGGAFYRPGFGYYGYPHIGFYLGILPYGYYPFYWDSSLYYYYGGIFYTPNDNGGYQVTAPPIGAGIPSLPEHSSAIKIDGVQYFEADGVYYKEGVDDKGKKLYIVAGRDGVLNTGNNVTDPNASVAMPKVGDIVNQLPDDCRKVILNGKKYFVSPDGIYYEKVTDPNGNTAWRIASLPEEEDKGA